MTIVLENPGQLTKKRYNTKPRNRDHHFFDLEQENQLGDAYIDAQGNFLTSASDTQSKYHQQQNHSTRRSHKASKSIIPEEEAQREQSLYKTRLYSDVLNALMTVEVVKRGLSKVFVRAWNTSLKLSGEFELHLKQACSYLMWYGNDFERFIREALTFHPGGKIVLLDMHKIRYMAALQNNSY